MLAYGLVKAAHPDQSDAEIWNHICIIDTENGSGSLYVGTNVGSTTVGEYLTIHMRPPFSAQRYLEAIQMAEDQRVEFLIIDSLSHAWSGEGGMLEVQSKVAQRIGNSYTAWREVTPWHNRLVDKLLQSTMHVIVTMRTKTEYIIEDNERGKKTPRKVGLAPDFRAGIDYEFTVFFELAQDHTCCATKDRTGCFDGIFFQVTPSSGSIIHQWLQAAKPIIAEQTRDDQSDLALYNHSALRENVDRLIQSYCEGMNAKEKQLVAEEIKQITNGVVNYRNITDPDILAALQNRFSKEGCN